MESKSNYNESGEGVHSEAIAYSIQDLTSPQPSTSTSKLVEDITSEVSLMQIEHKLEPYVFSGDNSTPNLTLFNDYNTCLLPLLRAFRYLNLQDLLRASSVSKVWNEIASSKLLWNTVIIDCNLKVTDWTRFKYALKKHGTKSLYMRDMGLPSQREANIMWKSFCQAVKDLPDLKSISFNRCTPSAIEQTARNCPQLERLAAASIEGDKIDLTNIANCKNLTELMLTAEKKMEIRNLRMLKNLKSISVLTLISFIDIQEINDVVGANITVLELGDCFRLNENFSQRTLPHLVSLKKLRLVDGCRNCPTKMFLEAVSKLPNLKQLELINYLVHPGFESSLAQCTNLECLLIVPIYDEQSHITCHLIYNGVITLAQTLKHFGWAFTHELLMITHIASRIVEYTQQLVEHIPFMSGDLLLDGYSMGIIKITTLKNLFKENLPNTNVQLFQIPFNLIYYLKAIEIE